MHLFRDFTQKFLSHKLVSSLFIPRCPIIIPLMYISVRNRANVHTTGFVLFEIVTIDERKEQDQQY